jgi:hypothetical protein
MKLVTASKKQIALAGALIFLIMAGAEVLQPHFSRPTGRWSFLFGPIWDAFGWPGLAGYWLVLVIPCAIIFFAKDGK